MRLPLSDTHPDVAVEWHSFKNGTLTPDSVTSGSTKVVWWQCRNDPEHEWRTRVQNRTCLRSPCPICSGYAVTPQNSLHRQHPDIASEWDRSMNAPLTPDDVKAGSGRQVWWRCRHNPSHLWTATPWARTRHRSGCPFCAGQRASPEMSLQALRPDLAAEWDTKRNGSLTPLEVTLGSKKKVWWRCRAVPSHTWSGVIRSRVRGWLPCPKCSRRGRRRGAEEGIGMRPVLGHSARP
jgi:Probable Zinc-ribbon domain